MTERFATARALANVALVKYFGKRDTALNLPAAGSLSLTLEPLATVTSVSFEEGLEEDAVLLGGLAVPRDFAGRVSAFLDLVRRRAGLDHRARVDTDNSFPTAAGLASSASGFAALALASTAALGIEAGHRELSALARRGSGSAARSIPGGAVIWHAGREADGSDSFAESIAAPGELPPLRLVVGVSDPGPKALGSTAAMEHTRATSPYYRSWIETAAADLEDGMEAVRGGDLQRLGEIAERSALSMHAAAMAARPGVVFWSGATVEALHLVARLRKAGTGAWFTCDAGPQPKILCSYDDSESVSRELSQLPGIKDIIICRPGGGTRLI